MLQARLKINWSRAKTDADGRIIGWDDYRIGDVIEVSEKDISSFSSDAYEIIIQEKVQKSIKVQKRKIHR